MNAFAGILARAGQPVSPQNLDAMQDALAYRGTTGESSHEILPLTLTGALRLDNRSDLCAALGLPQTSTLSDNELTLAAYEKWGEGCTERLQGDFAFAIDDRRNQRLFCARDRFGVRPFFYHLTPDEMIYASEIRALLALPRIPRRLNEERLADIFILSEDTAHTCWQEIQRLPPAHCLTITSDTAHLRRYWTLDAERALPRDSDAAYAEEFHALFTEAVRARLQSPFPVGAQLSGGLDSSAIVTVARHLRGPDNASLPTFSLVFGGQPYDESRYIDAVLAGVGLEPNCLFGDDLPPLEGLAALLNGAEPFLAPNFFFQEAMFRAAQAQGIRVLLDGFDGDTVIGHGIAHLSVLARSGRWRTLRREIHGLARQFGTAPKTILNQQVLRPLLPPAVTQCWDRLHGRPPETVWDKIFAPDFVRRAGLPEKAAEYLAKERGALKSARHHQARRLSTGLIPGVLELHDRQGAAYGLETRSPFLDARLVEFCLALPPEQKLRDGWTRVILRNGLPELPEQIRQRGGKANFSPLIARTLRAHHRDQIEEMLRHAPDILSPYLDVPALKHIYNRYLEMGRSSDALTLWKAISLDLWLRQFAATFT